MAEAAYLTDVIIILLAAVISVVVFQRLRLASLMGYLVAGAAIGPAALGLIEDAETARSLGELGVVFLLFTVGLELPFERLKVLRPGSFALGAAQILITGAAIAGAAYAAGATVAAAIVIGGALALSSTAVVLQLLTERGELNTRIGRTAFAVLLVQDLAVGPLLVLVLALSRPETAVSTALGLAALKAAAALIIILVAGRIVLRPLFRAVAASRNPEIFAALTLLVVLCTGFATHMAGLSMAFGAFLAGMMLAGTHYRHQVAAVIQPFRGLLLGLFFISVGMFIDLRLIAEQTVPILGLLVALLLAKLILLAALAAFSGQSTSNALHLGALLCQGGEFAFVLLGLGLTAGIVPSDAFQQLIAVVTLSMMLTPLLAAAGRKAAHMLQRSRAPDVDDFAETSDEISNHVIIAGFGRAGRAIANRLRSDKVDFVAVDMDPDGIAQAHSHKLPVYYGDATRPEVLSALNLEKARALIVALDNPRIAVQVVTVARYMQPSLKIFARARDDAHGEELRSAGADGVAAELFDSAQRLAGTVLTDTDTEADGGRL